MPADPLKDIFGGGESPSEEPLPEAPEASAEELPPGFQEAFDEYQTAPSAESMYRMIEACKGGSGLEALLPKKK